MNSCQVSIKLRTTVSNFWHNRRWFTDSKEHEDCLIISCEISMNPIIKMVFFFGYSKIGWIIGCIASPLVWACS